MTYKRTLFDVVRLHGGGLLMTYAAVDLAFNTAWLRLGLLLIMLVLFIRFEGELLNGRKSAKHVDKK